MYVTSSTCTANHLRNIHLKRLFILVVNVGDQLCSVKNSNLMTCIMPQVRLPTDFPVHEIVDNYITVSPEGDIVSERGGSDDRDHANVRVGLSFDDYYTSTASNRNISLQFYPQPTFRGSTNPIVYRPQSYSHIDITVRLSLFAPTSTRSFSLSKMFYLCCILCNILANQRKFSLCQGDFHYRPTAVSK